MKRWGVALLAIAAATAAAPTALAAPGAPGEANDPVPRVRTLVCDDGTVFEAEQVREAWPNSPLPRSWRNTDPGGSPSAFVVYAVNVVQEGTTEAQLAAIANIEFDQTQGVAQNQDLVTCSIGSIPIGILKGFSVDYVGAFTN